MGSDTPHILTINVGSSSIKFALFTVGVGLKRVFEGAINQIGQSGSALQVQGAAEADTPVVPVIAPDLDAAVIVLMDWIETRIAAETLAAIGHRVVHGGPNYSAPRRATPEMVEELRRFTAFDLQHLPQEISLIDAFAQRFPEVPQVACFDTAFFHDLPRVARQLPIPRQFEAKGVRRYGFHGLSYEFLSRELARQAGAKAANSRVILAHLGNGVSLAALHHGKPIDTSMGFTPAAGVPMGTRSGDLDPGLALYFSRTESMGAVQFNNMVNFQSGLLGMSEISSDVRLLLEREATDVRAAEALAVFCYQIRKWIGAFAAALGGLDQLVFAGGVGENSPIIRARICNGLEFLGIDLDDARNSQSAPLISLGDGGVKVRVIPTDEEVMIATLVAQFLDNNWAKGRSQSAP